MAYLPLVRPRLAGYSGVPTASDNSGKATVHGWSASPVDSSRVVSDKGYNLR